MSMDSALEGQLSNEDGIELVRLASRCLQDEAHERPTARWLVTALRSIEKQIAVYILVIWTL